MNDLAPLMNKVKCEQNMPADTFRKTNRKSKIRGKLHQQRPNGAPIDIKRQTSMCAIWALMREVVYHSGDVTLSGVCVMDFVNSFENTCFVHVVFTH